MHVIDTGGPGGAETVFLETATGLDPQQFQSVPVVSRDGWLTSAIRSRGHVPLVIAASGSFNLAYLRQLVRTIREHRVDVIAAHLYGSAIYAGLASMLTHVPVVSILHGQSDITNAGRFSGLKKRIVAAKSSRLVFVSEKLQQELAAALGADASRCHVIPNGVNLARFTAGSDRPLRRELGLSDEIVLIGAVGNIRRPKAYDVFLQAARALLDKSASYHFAVAGEGSGKLYEELLRLRQALGLEKHVTFLGLRQDVPSILGSLDAYVLSSDTEGFSIACVEAMGTGVPVVATRSGGPEEIIQDGVSGLLVPTRSPEVLAEAVHRLVSDDSLRKRLVRGGRARVEERYALEKMLGAYAGLFRAVAGSRAT